MELYEKIMKSDSLGYTVTCTRNVQLRSPCEGQEAGLAGQLRGWECGTTRRSPLPAGLLHGRWNRGSEDRVELEKYNWQP